MHNPAYLYLEYPPSFVSDGSALEPCALEPAPFEWTDDEIESIRIALKRLTSIRVMNPNDVEDLVQETLLTMISRHPGAELEKGLLVWSMGILRRKLGNYYRKVQRYAPLSEHKASVGHTMPIPAPDRKVFREELERLVKEVLTQIPPFQRQALELMLSGLSAREIAEELSPVRYQNVINRLHRGRKKLAEALAKHGYGPGTAASLRRMKPSRGNKSADSRKTASAKPERSASSGK